MTRQKKKKIQFSTLLKLSHASVVLPTGERILSDLSFAINCGERWAIVGPNGSGKTTILKILNGYLRPTTGRLSVHFGEEENDATEIRRRSGFVSSYLDTLLESQDNVLDVVVSGRYGATRLWQIPPYEDVLRARKLLGRLNLGRRFEDRRLADLSQGERQRVLIARSLMPDPLLLTFDEPCASLDLGARESFLRGLEVIFRDNSSPSMVYVTHRLDEIPAGFSHALLLRKGRAVALGLISKVITSENLSRCFGIDVEVRHWRNRMYAVVAD